MIKSKILANEIKTVLETKEITIPVNTHTIVCNKPINNPTKKYPKIKS